MENMLNQLGNNFRNFQPEVPAHMETRVMNALKKENKSFWRFSLTYLNIYVVGILIAGACAWALYSDSNAPQMAQQVQNNLIHNAGIEQISSQQIVVPQTTILADDSRKIQDKKAELKTQPNQSANGVLTCSGPPELLDVDPIAVQSNDVLVRIEESQEVQDEHSKKAEPAIESEKKVKGRKFTVSTFHK
jgi:hypothetical protein